jgi:hypothetical protein
VSVDLDARKRELWATLRSIDREYAGRELPPDVLAEWQRHEAELYGIEEEISRRAEERIRERPTEEVA